MSKKRDCLPSAERENYIKAVQERGYTSITLGCKNRYIDEFLRFCFHAYGFTDPGRVESNYIEDWADTIAGQSIQLESKRAKMREVLAWFHWLAQQGTIARNPAKSLKPNELLAC